MSTALKLTDQRVKARVSLSDDRKQMRITVECPHEEPYRQRALDAMSKLIEPARVKHINAPVEVSP